jgi:hypothetical protein
MTTESRRPDIEAIEIRSGVVNIYNVKIRDAGIVAVNATVDLRGPRMPSRLHSPSFPPLVLA